MVRIATTLLLAFAAIALAGNNGQGINNGAKKAQGGVSSNGNDNGGNRGQGGSSGATGNGGGAVGAGAGGNNDENQDQEGNDGTAGAGAEAGAGTGGTSKTPAVDARIKELTALQKKKEEQAVEAEANNNPGLAAALRQQKNGAIATQLSQMKQAQAAAN